MLPVSPLKPCKSQGVVCAPFGCGVHCQCDAKGRVCSPGLSTDRQTYWQALLLACLLAIKKAITKIPNTLILLHLFLLGKSLDPFRGTLPSYSILRIKLKMYVFQSVLHNMPLIVWSKVAFSFVEWRRQMSLRPRMLVLSARCSAEMWSVLPGAQWSVIFSKTVSCWCRHYVNIIAYVWD